MTPEQEMADRNCILRCTVGSQLYGTATENSDHDSVGIFIPDEEYIFGFKRVETVDFSTKDKDKSGKNTKFASDCTFYTLKKFCRLALDNNPNVLEILFVPKNEVEELYDTGAKLQSLYPYFVSKNVKHRFLGYAFSQKHKMTIKMENYERLEEVSKFLNQSPEKFMLELPEHPLILRDKSNSFFRIGDINIPVTAHVSRTISIIDSRLKKFSNRKELIEKYNFDTKYASHLIRLLLEGKELLETGKLVFPLSYANLILDIKNGKYKFGEVLEMSDVVESEVEGLYNKTSLRSTPDSKKIEKFLIETYKNFLGFI
jgi:uncharacterized protein